MKKINSRQRRLTIQAAEYLVSGGAYFWSGYALFAYLWSSLHWSLWWAKLAANIFGWTINFLLQRYWVFKNPQLKGHLGKVTRRYTFITLVDFVMDYFIVYGLKQAGLTPYLGQFVSAGFFTIWNYIWYRWWVFPVRLPAPRHPGFRRSRARG
ncbi:GtrA family protein [Candidatus Saccharibacteria bacterium]|nr:GtrA family protein [Candidatus Saccharibacteria bacterium]